jgi:hypothetical protein
MPSANPWLQPWGRAIWRRSRHAWSCHTLDVGWTTVSHRYYLYPELVQLPTLERHWGDARFVWNLALEQANCWRRGGGRSPGPGSSAAVD